VRPGGGLCVADAELAVEVVAARVDRHAASVADEDAGMARTRRHKDGPRRATRVELVLNGHIGWKVAILPATLTGFTQALCVSLAGDIMQC
jgi:hypothetical protein